MHLDEWTEVKKLLCVPERHQSSNHTLLNTPAANNNELICKFSHESLFGKLRYTNFFPQLRLCSGGARRRRRRRPPTASRLKGPRKQKSFAYKLLKRGLANLMSPTSTSGVAPPLLKLDPVTP
ncbi:hypothetical protein EVAR_65458_1 [Eumeta japonica]|uniref:Uncharacterized protein n=1 Tax=Eumeta variegata TaxID=151549 RepID=A0A4C1YV75_EUMVA|nr:hypothetical protein EVAR_65458_1 [Eumeta japonica]